MSIFKVMGALIVACLACLYALGGWVVVGGALLGSAIGLVLGSPIIALQWWLTR